MTFQTQALKDAAVVEAQRVVDASQGQAKVNAEGVLAKTQAAAIVE